MGLGVGLGLNGTVASHLQAPTASENSRGRDHVATDAHTYIHGTAHPEHLVVALASHHEVVHLDDEEERDGVEDEVLGRLAQVNDGEGTPHAEEKHHGVDPRAGLVSMCSAVMHCRVMVRFCEPSSLSAQTMTDSMKVDSGKTEQSATASRAILFRRPQSKGSRPSFRR